MVPFRAAAQTRKLLKFSPGKIPLTCATPASFAPGASPPRHDLPVERYPAVYVLSGSSRWRLRLVLQKESNDGDVT